VPKELAPTGSELDATETDGEVQIQVAVKTVVPKTGPTGVAEFTDEAALQLGLRHPNVAACLGVCMAEKPYLCVLEFILYGDLGEVLSACQEKGIVLRTTEIMYFGQQMAAGLGYMASNKVVHLDMAARNCLFHKKNVVKIADFGLSRRYTPALDGESPERVEGYRLVGKMKIPFLWCPPECLPRKMWDKSVDSFKPIFNEKSDMWAWGVVLWEIATYGERPYGSGKLVQLLEKIDNGLRLSFPEGTSPEIVEVAKRAQLENAADRPTFAALEAELWAKVAPGLAGMVDVGALLNASADERLRQLSNRAVEMKKMGWMVVRAMLWTHSATRNRCRNLRDIPRRYCAWAGSVFQLVNQESHFLYLLWMSIKESHLSTSRGCQPESLISLLVADAGFHVLLSQIFTLQGACGSKV
jgi:serine/threonine protein kinase